MDRVFMREPPRIMILGDQCIMVLLSPTAIHFAVSLHMAGSVISSAGMLCCA